MASSFDNFENLFDPVILQRAKGYHRAGRVNDVDYDNPPLIHAIVDGVNEYDVDIRLKGNAIASVACTCPYDRSPYCKHVGAVLFEIREQRSNAAKDGGTTKSKKEKPSGATYKRVQKYFEKQARDEAIGNKSHRRIRKSKADAAPIGLGEARKIITAPIRSFDRRRSYPSPYENDDALQGIYSITDSAAKMSDTVHAVALVLIAIEHTVDFFSHHDDSGGIAGDAFHVLLQLLSELNEEIATYEGDEICLSVFDSIMTTLQKKVFDGWSYDFEFLEACLPLTISQLVRKAFETQVDSILDASSDNMRIHTAARFLRLKYQSMKLNGDVRAEQFAAQHIDYPYFLHKAVGDAFLSEEYERVKQLIADENERARQGHFMRQASGLPWHEFPHGWLTILEAIYEATDDAAAILDLYECYVAKEGGTKYIERIKRMSPDDWPHRRDRIVDALKSKSGWSETFETLMRKESLVSEAMAYCESFPERAVHLCSVIAKQYPQRTKDLLRKLIYQKAQRTTGRVVYQEICSIIERYQSIFGTEDAMLVVDDLIDTYTQRRAMKEELTQLKLSWE